MSAFPIYLDHQATTPTDPRVLEAMLPYFSERFGNAASRTHRHGWDAEQAVDEARAAVATAVGGDTVVFTSGATEAINLALVGRFESELRGSGKRRRIVTQVTEHKAVLDVVEELEGRGAEVVRLPVDGDGRVSLDAVSAQVTEDTLLVSIMAANNEVGTLQPVPAIGAICHSRGVPFHVDGAQSVGKVPIHMTRDHVDMLSISGHKLYGPKGVGALVLLKGAPRVQPQILGGAHEQGMRSGTLNVPGIIGLRSALGLCLDEREAAVEREAGLRDDLWRRLSEAVPDAILNGHPVERLPGNLNVSFPGVEGEALLLSLKDDVAVSSGSACTSATVEPSHVLRAIGRSTNLALGSLRFGLGRSTTGENVAHAAQSVIREVRRLRAFV
ncbi:MAG: cysteine desulfurase family protein [Planctomycetota bacterium]|nr:cysteine desulfurase family protein [Planctomycetota bacterium]